MGNSRSNHSRSSRSRNHHSSLVADGSVLEATEAPELLELPTVHPERQVAVAGILQQRHGDLLQRTRPLSSGRPSSSMRRSRLHQATTMTA